MIKYILYKYGGARIGGDQEPAPDDSMNPRPEASSERIRDVAILIYMVGNALTFSALISGGLAEAEGIGNRVIPALALSFIWPLYWAWRVLFD